MKRLIKNTVWNVENLPHIQPRYQSIYTTLFPGLYLIIMAYGWFSLPQPILAIDVLAGPVYGDLWSICLFFAAGAAFLGQVARPQRRTVAEFIHSKRKWQQVELAALCAIIVLETIYQVALFSSGLLLPVPTIDEYLVTLSPPFVELFGLLPDWLLNPIAWMSRIRYLAILALVVYLFPPIWKVRDTVRAMRPAE